MPTFIREHRTLISIVLLLVVTAAALYGLHLLLGEVRLSDVRAALRSLGWPDLLKAVALTAFSYLTLTGYDVLALRTIGRPLPYRTAALASFVSYTLSHNLGLSVITGGSARYRIYSAAGLTMAEVARVVAIAGITFWCGVIFLFGIALFVQPGALRFHAWIAPYPLQLALGGAICFMVVVYLLLTAFRQAPLRIGRFSLPLPTTRWALAQFALAALDIVSATAALYVLVPGAAGEDFPAFLVAYVVAMVTAIVTHAPGGLGVFEAVMLVALPHVEKAALFSALVAYRAIYYLVPLIFGVLLLMRHERERLRAPLDAALGRARLVLTGLAPTLMAVLTFAGGAVLLVSGALPALENRLTDLREVLPLPFIEASHFAASLVGAALLFIAPGLFRRLDGAFHAVRALLAAGAVFSLAKGFDYEEALILTAILALLQWTRPAFYRRTRLIAEPLAPGWLAAALVALLCAGWIGFFAYKHVDYSDELWWQFALHGDASRFLRSLVGIAIVAAGFALWHLLAPARAPDESMTLDPQAADRALAAADRTEAFLAFSGDKRFLLNETGDAFVMYQVQGRSWIAIGDPVGPREAWPDLMWRFKELADAHQGNAIFYQLSTEALPIAVDLGLQLHKLGEEARVDLAAFTLEGGAAKSLRQAERRVAKLGATFEVVPAIRVPPLLPELKTISDAWLADKGASEKGFSLGRFDPDYLSRFDMALVRLEGRIVAFANLWATPNKVELSIDLMRHVAEAPNGVMDYLFVSLMTWGKGEGYRWFNLGMAPLSGLEARHLAPLWAKVGAFLYRHGEGIYSFEGLRAFKDKFRPAWTPKYLAAPGGVGLVRALIDVTALVSGGRLSAARRAQRRPVPASAELPSGIGPGIGDAATSA